MVTGMPVRGGPRLNPRDGSQQGGPTFGRPGFAAAVPFRLTAAGRNGSLRHRSLPALAGRAEGEQSAQVSGMFWLTESDRKCLSVRV
jgi:hypothetical protein